VTERATAVVLFYTILLAFLKHLQYVLSFTLGQGEREGGEIYLFIKALLARNV
jgi:hypothetical protein